MKTETIIAGLEKLYAKRKNLDAQISTVEKKLVSEVKSAAKAGGAVKGKAGAAKKTVRRVAKRAKSAIAKF
ncbi:MAG: hypothetical protein LBI67_01135 [Treponema sp.]|jgi:hypothetical protein|nr:hypothetical protein [Treponema sp.]